MEPFAAPGVAAYDARVLRALLLLAVVGCSSKSATPSAPAPASDLTLRIRIAYAEARRGDGLAELRDLATSGDKHERLLALRGLGRIGGTSALAALRAALADRDRDIVAAAAAAIGLAASLDEEVPADVVTALVAAHRAHEHPAIVEALGRAGDAKVQPLLVTALAAGKVEAAIALGRHGRRTIAISNEARTALARATAAADVQLRYAATWALAREHITQFEAPEVASVNNALAARIADTSAEIRAQAISALARRKQVKAAAPAIEQALIDNDWRVVVEAIAALAPFDEHRAALVAVAARPAWHPQVRTKLLRTFIGKPIDANVRSILDELSVDLAERPFWLWLSGTTMFSNPDAHKGANKGPTWLKIESLSQWLATFGARDRSHLMLALLAEWAKTDAGALSDRRLAISAMLSHQDARVRATAIGALPYMWPAGDDRDHAHAISTVTAAIASKDPILAGSAIEAADALLERGVGDRPGLHAALVYRADGERDVELAASLYAIIGKRGIGEGAAACKQGVTGHPVLVKAAVTCLKKLGEPVPALADPPAAKPPFVDITQVIGRKLLWRARTAKGDVVIQLLPDVAPWAVATIVTLTRRGFYDGLEFHRVVPNFVVQGGDPTESGWGGPGFMIPAEPASTLDGEGFAAGGVGIADAGRDSGGSQWFVMHSRAPHLDGRYTWIGRVVEGANIANALVVGDEVQRATIELVEP